MLPRMHASRPVQLGGGKWAKDYFALAGSTPERADQLARHRRPGHDPAALTGSGRTSGTPGELMRPVLDRQGGE
jgi:hypothetical protein